LYSTALKVQRDLQITRGVAILGYVPVGDCGLVLLATRVKTVVTLPGGHDINLVTGSAWASVPLEVCACPLPDASHVAVQDLVGNYNPGRTFLMAVHTVAGRARTCGEHR
jgi:hypothetical protein